VADAAAEAATTEETYFPDRLIRPGEAAKALALSPRSLDKLHEQGILPKVHVLGAVRYRWSEVQAIIRHGTRTLPRRVIS
jgi:predicted DNA-binding transcriptional regulator AlpA